MAEYFKSFIYVICIWFGFRFSSKVMPLCLPRIGESYEDLQDCSIVGWGPTSFVGTVSLLPIRALDKTLWWVSWINLVIYFFFLFTLLNFTILQDSNQPNVGKVIIRPDHDCEEAYVKGTNNFTSSFVCAGSPEGIVNSCIGDSGGPLSCRRPGETKKSLYGIVSFGNTCKPFLAPDALTRVTKYLRWIYDKMSLSS